MKKVLVTVGALAIIAAPAIAKDSVPFSTQAPASPSEVDVVLAYEEGNYYAYGTSPGWTDNTVVNFEAPAGGPWALAEAIYYVMGAEMKPAEVWDISALSSPPVSIADDSITFMPAGTSWPPGAFTVVDVTGYGLSYNEGDLFGIGTTFNGFGDGIGLEYADQDGVFGHSWAIWYGSWTDDTYGYNVDDGIRAGLNGGGTPVESTTWGGVKATFK